MQIELRNLLDNNEMLSHIFLTCIKPDDLQKIIDTQVKGVDWQKESCKISVEMKIAGIEVNPKGFFDQWNKQMESMILNAAKNLVADNMGSEKLRDLQFKMNQLAEIIEGWESEINWDVENPLLKSNNI